MTTLMIHPYCASHCAPRSGALGSAQLQHTFMGLLTAVLPLLGLPSYNGVEDEEQPVAASPIAYAAKDCLQAVCNLLGPRAYLGTAAQLLLNSSSTVREAIHLAEVPGPAISYSRLASDMTINYDAT